ncbi:hypothetical protein ACWDUN_19165 [Mycobacterium sp. NPDC003323]
MESGRKARSLRYCLAVVTVCTGLAVAPVQVAWAQETDNGSTSAAGESTADRTADNDSATEPSRGAESPARPDPEDSTEPEESTEPEDEDEAEPDDPSEPGGDTPVTEEPEPTPDQQPTPTVGPKKPSLVVTQPDPTPAPEADPDRDEVVINRPVQRSVPAVRTVHSSGSAVGLLEGPAPLSTATTAPVAPNIPATLGAAAVEVTTPTPPKPLSPIATLLEIPGRIVNAVLQFLDFTAAVTGPRSPFNIAPINDLLFAAFREIERLVGLHRTPAVQPVLPSMTYTGPTDRPSPTVAQFLNASTAAYGWGTIPGGMVPFTVNGFQLQSTNIFSGMSGKAWVTPEGQVIIAYQGTTGGTNLLVNPLITLTQLAADMQVILTGTTPLAFYDALRFARRVQDEAALQGYAADDVFVTGHSLGGWQAQFVAQRTGLAGIGFESPGMNTRAAGNGADSNFVNIAQYGSPVAFMATDLPGLQPFFPPYVPTGGAKPHYGPIVLIGDREAMNPLVNSAAMWGKSLIGSLVFAVDFLGNFFQYHLMGVQAYHLDVDTDPGVVPWLGTRRGTVHTGYGELTIQQLLKAASDDGILVTP